jgi:hypothetical protein
VYLLKGRTVKAGPLHIEQASTPELLGATDWDRDGFTDLIVQLDAGRLIAFRRGTGDMAFGPHMELARSRGPFTVVQRSSGPAVVFARGGELWQVTRGDTPERVATTHFERIFVLGQAGTNVVVLGAPEDASAWRALVYAGDWTDPPCRAGFELANGFPVDADADGGVDFLTPTSCPYCTSNYGMAVGGG